MHCDWLQLRATSQKMNMFIFDYSRIAVAIGNTAWYGSLNVLPDQSRI